MNALAQINANLAQTNLLVASLIPDLNPAPGSGLTETQGQAVADSIATINTTLSTALAAVTPPPAAPTP